MKARRVYFNSKCPVCDAGVTRQREKMDAAARGCDIEWIDINSDPDLLSRRGVTIDDVRRKLYVEDDHGRLHVGAEAFAALWSQTPGQRWRGRLMQLPLLVIISRWAYDAFATLLYRWNRYRGRW